MSVFPAEFPGQCAGGCGQHFPPGTLIAVVEGRVIVQDCCGDIGPDAAGPAAQPETILPRGKTAADKCRACFQIPASNGVCGCS